jgi:hypothetical protein
MKQEVNDCISNLENHVHAVFAAQRVAGEDFVFRPMLDSYAALDDYCDDANFHDVRPPLLITGPAGTGKTALLANWLRKREQNSTVTDEFLFWHAVGCSRQSLGSNSLIRRLIAALQSKFELSRPLPRNVERLSWELPRFLELAAKKGKLVIVVDGVHRLRGHDDNEDSLSWLPLDLPPNVRVILSVTEALSSFNSFDDSDHAAKQEHVKKSKILMELARRKLPVVSMFSLENSTARAVVLDFLETSIRSETAALTVGPYSDLPTVAKSDGQSSSSQMHRASTSRAVSGLLFFECHIQALVRHRLGGNPQFLRLFLKSLQYVCAKGHSLWATFHDWLQAQSLEELYDRVLVTCEQGFDKSREHTQSATDLAMREGGLAALKKLYPSHPALA